jgi:hypothetical protein
MRSKGTRTLLIISALGVIIHIIAFLVCRRDYLPVLSAAMLVCVLLLALLNICMSLLQNRLARRLTRENEFVLQKRELENAAVVAEQNLEQSGRIYKFYHDINNHLSVAVSMLEEQDLQSAGEYFRKMRESLADEARHD